MRGQAFYKMTGSGNDFVIFDVRDPSFDVRDTSGDQAAAARGASGGASPALRLGDPAFIQRLCARGTGVGADGVVLLEPASGAPFRMIYFNSDGSRAAMCGNATLCVTALAARLGIGGAARDEADGELTFESDDGLVRARMRDGRPAVDLRPVRSIREDAEIPAVAGETRIGFADAGVPHLVVLVPDVSQVDVVARGRTLRTHPAVAAAGGANVNFVARASRAAGGGRGSAWRVRTYERGVEGETLACGTGAVASALLLTLWGESSSPVSLTPPSGMTLTVYLEQTADGLWIPTLQGEGRLVYRGELQDV
ncbi:MAG TPA: diaminopimelate epimerase [Gemmatimonadaceae bacterium]|nr:diaminopimelate epimerase [Gemmatimonadaceae bacterium]